MHPAHATLGYHSLPSRQVAAQVQCMASRRESSSRDSRRTLKVFLMRSSVGQRCTPPSHRQRSPWTPCPAKVELGNGVSVVDVHGLGLTRRHNHVAHRRVQAA